MENFDMFGIMVDCSRGAVYKTEALEKFIVIMKKMGYNMLSLYMEDTFELDGEPYFGSMRGRYSADELRRLDSFAVSYGVELVPCIQTLGHLDRLKRHKVYADMFDTESALLADDERVYVLIDKMFSFCRSVFSSKHINIGMDEALGIGFGKYREIHGECDKYAMLQRHIARVNGLAKKHGLKPMMWSDIFFRFATGEKTYRVDELVITDAEKSMLPDDMGIVYWDYYTLRRERYDIMFENHKLLSSQENLFYAGGIWTWTGFIPHNDATMRFVVPGLLSCIEKGIRNVFFCMWGDDGGECSIFSALPAMLEISRFARGFTDKEGFKREFYDIVGIPYEDFILIELPDGIEPRKMKNPNDCWEYLTNPSKYMLYSDPLMGLYDFTVRGGEGKIYEGYEKRLLPLSVGGEYALHFNMSRALCSVLRYKYELGVRTHEAYKRGKDALRSVISDYENALNAVRDFHSAYRELWFSEKKAQGFEIHDMRIAGVEARLSSALIRIKDYIDGRIPFIEELSEKALPPDIGDFEPGAVAEVSYSRASRI